MITIYTDASEYRQFQFCAWGCVIITPKNKTLTFCGSYRNMEVRDGELMAVIKALGNVKQMEGPITIHTDSDYVYEPYLKRTGSKFLSLVKTHSSWAAFSKYLTSRPIKLKKIYRDENPAHAVAYAEMDRLRNLEKQKRLQIMPRLRWNTDSACIYQQLIDFKFEDI